MFSGTSETSTSVPHAAKSRPSKPPSAESTTLSTSSCRMMRARLAPKAERSAISFARTVARASRRLATFALAIKSTQATAPKST